MYSSGLPSIGQQFVQSSLPCGCTLQQTCNTRMTTFRPHLSKGSFAQGHT